MIYLSGDIHGSYEIQKVIDFFEIETLQTKLSEEDYLIILGDAGIFWDGGVRDRYVREQLEALPVTVLWIDGNHENFDLIEKTPTAYWNGGRVQFTGKKIIHLMRGNVYEIGRKTFFVMGGGFSIDKMYRVKNVSWWQEEMPSEEEYQRGMNSLKVYGNNVDYILTHTAPRSIAEKLVDNILPGEERLQNYLDNIADITTFRKWYFGHWHMDVVYGQFIGLYHEIVKLDEDVFDGGLFISGQLQNHR